MPEQDPADTYPSIPHQESVPDDVYPLFMRDGRMQNSTAEAFAEMMTAAVPSIKHLTETMLAENIVDGGGAAGTLVSTGEIPAGAIVLAAKVVVNAGFAGDVSADMTIGDGTDEDRYMPSAGSIDIFTTAPEGVPVGDIEGQKYHTAATTVTLTIDSDSNITPVLAGGGSLTLSIYYINTV